MDRFSQAPISQLIGFEVEPEAAAPEAGSSESAAEPGFPWGKTVVRLATGERLHNPMGRIHGGVLAALADAAMGIAFGRTLETGQDFSTIDLHVHFMRPVRSGELRATGWVVQRGLRVGYCQCQIHDARGRLLASGSCSCTVVEL